MPESVNAFASIAPPARALVAIAIADEEKNALCQYFGDLDLWRGESLRLVPRTAGGP